ncbi:APC family permease [Kutzneria sp. NPDC051319]|uniref:APC family permease n=1 Tax=Kutzneria sp. NPDC051319 TaxID=3155047 RepID=UPI003414EBC8
MATRTPLRERGLARPRLGVVQILFFVVAASGPLYAIAGGVTATYAVTGVVGVPLSFVLLAPVLALFAVGYAAMSRYITGAGAFYPYVVNGLGRPAGVAISFVALVAYNAIQISVYGLFGWSLSNWINPLLGLDTPWWLWGLAIALVIGVLGVLRVDINAKVLGVVLVLECAVIVVTDIALLGSPAGGGAPSLAPLAPSSLFTTGVGAVFAFSVAVFTGFEGAASYSEEVRDPRRTVARATYLAVALTAVLYTLSALAMADAAGPANVVGAAQAQGPGLLFGLNAQRLGSLFSDVSYVLFLTSQFASLLSFHNSIARYFFALGREGVLPEALARTNRRTGAPAAGSGLQTALGLIVVAVFAIAGRDPFTELFGWLGTMASTGVVFVLAAVSVSVIGFFRKREHDEPAWRHTIAPALAAVALLVILVLILWNFDVLLGTAGNSPLRWILPGILLLAAVIGLVRGSILRRRKPEVYAGIGKVE